MRWSCREALPWTTKTKAILTGLAGMYSTESSSHWTLLLAFPVQKQNTGHLSVSTGRVQTAEHSTSALLQRPFGGRVSSPGLSHPACAPFSVPTQGQHPWGSSPCPTTLHKNPGVTEFCRAPPEYSHLNLQRNPLWVCNLCPKYSNNDEAEVPQKETPCLAKAAHSHDQHSPPEKLVELCCWTAAGDYWLIAFICNSRLNAICISSLPHGGVGLFQYSLKFLLIFLF